MTNLKSEGGLKILSGPGHGYPKDWPGQDWTKFHYLMPWEGEWAETA